MENKILRYFQNKFRGGVLAMQSTASKRLAMPYQAELKEELDKKGKPTGRYFCSLCGYPIKVSRVIPGGVEAAFMTHVQEKHPPLEDETGCSDRPMAGD